MGFILCCAVLAGLIQLLVLSHREKLPKGVPVLSFCLMELIPLARRCISPLSDRSAGSLDGASAPRCVCGSPVAFWRAVPPPGSWTTGGGGSYGSILLDNDCPM